MTYTREKTQHKANQQVLGIQIVNNLFRELEPDELHELPQIATDLLRRLATPDLRAPIEEHPLVAQVILPPVRDFVKKRAGIVTAVDARLETRVLLFQVLEGVVAQLAGQAYADYHHVLDPIGNV